MKNSKLVSLILSLGLVSVMFVGCSEDDDVIATITQAVASSDPAPAELVGTWQTDCEVNGSESFMANAVISDGLLVLSEMSYYHDTTCSGLDATNVSSFSMTFGDTKHDTASATGVYDVDGANGVFSITPNSASEVTEFNADTNNTGVCGFTDWALNVTKILTVATCTNPDHAAYVGAESADFYDIISVQSDNKLYIGDTSTSTYDGTTAAKRPIALEINGLTKQ